MMIQSKTNIEDPAFLGRNHLSISKSKIRHLFDGIRPSLDGINNHLAYANRRNTPNSAATPNKPPILPKLSTIYDLFMQNKANFPKAQMNISTILTKDYENIANCKLGENKPNTNPIKPNTKPIKANKMPKQTQYKPNQTQPVVSLPALSVVEGVEPISKAKNAANLYPVRSS